MGTVKKEYTSKESQNCYYLFVTRGLDKTACYHHTDGFVVWTMYGIG